MSELLPCPFCGSKAEEYCQAYPDDDLREVAQKYYGVACKSCESGHVFGYTDYESAIKAWNTRPLNNGERNESTPPAA